MKLSIIIAMYNTELYIEKCIRSIYWKNSFDNADFEVIVVNDGSTDRSLSIAEELRLEYANLIIVNQSNNLGQSSARNKGFLNAKGEYILCVDSDDEIDASLLQNLFDRIGTTKVDLIAFDAVVINEENKLYKNKFNYKCDEFINGSPIDFVKNKTILGAMCFYVYRSEIIRLYDLKLHEGIKHEDEEFVTLFFYYSNTMSYFKIPLYYYRSHPTSTTNIRTEQHIIKLINDLINVVVVLKEHTLKENGHNYKGKNKLLINKYNQLIITVLIKLMRGKEYGAMRGEIINILKEKKILPLKNLKQMKLKFRFVGCIINLLTK